VIVKHGVSPASIPDWLALVGDTADGIPGITGWGKASAAKVLTKWKAIESIPTIPRSGASTVRGADRLAGALRESREARDALQDARDVAPSTVRSTATSTRSRGKSGPRQARRDLRRGRTGRRRDSPVLKIDAAAAGDAIAALRRGARLDDLAGVVEVV